MSDCANKVSQSKGVGKGGVGGGDVGDGEACTGQCLVGCVGSERVVWRMLDSSCSSLIGWPLAVPSQHRVPIVFKHVFAVRGRWLLVAVVAM